MKKINLDPYPFSNFSSRFFLFLGLRRGLKGGNMRNAEENFHENAHVLKNIIQSVVFSSNVTRLVRCRPTCLYILLLTFIHLHNLNLNQFGLLQHRLLDSYHLLLSFPHRWSGCHTEYQQAADRINLCTS